MVNIASLGAFYPYRGKSIKLVDGDFNVFLYINEEGRPTDEKMVDWQDCADDSVFWEYDGRALSDVVEISIIEDASERPCKRRKRIKF
tara:strand:+ start:3074 stop:3337 length:264 start_codon:yes stop_codon:yes gene_type:complete